MRSDLRSVYAPSSLERGFGRGGPPGGGAIDQWLDRLAPCPWSAHAGLSAWRERRAALPSGLLRRRAPLYTPAQRARRDASPWTRVQAVLAPLQFVICAASLLLILRYLATGEGCAVATGSILLKTGVLYAIMVTGSIWEKDVFGKWLFAPAFFWEDMVSLLVLILQTAYVAALVCGWGAPAQQMTIAIAAYGAYAVNASQFLMKLRAARLDAAPGLGVGAPARA